MLSHFLSHDLCRLRPREEGREEGAPGRSKRHPSLSDWQCLEALWMWNREEQPSRGIPRLRKSFSLGTNQQFWPRNKSIYYERENLAICKRKQKKNVFLFNKIFWIYKRHSIKTNLVPMGKGSQFFTLIQTHLWVSSGLLGVRAGLNGVMIIHHPEIQSLRILEKAQKYFSNKPDQTQLNGETRGWLACRRHTTKKGRDLFALKALICGQNERTSIDKSGQKMHFAAEKNLFYQRPSQLNNKRELIIAPANLVWAEN